MDHINRLDIREIAIGRSSALPAPWQITGAREMTREDMILLLAPHTPDPKAPLARISAPHHMLAKLVAVGKEPVEISMITGYKPERIRTLQRDPSFMELVAHYEATTVTLEADMVAQITHITLSVGQRLQEKLDDPDAVFTTKELRELFTAGLDRVGHGPTSKSVLTVNDPTRVLDKLNNILATESRGRVLPRDVITAEFTEVTNDRPTSSSGTEESHDGNPEPVADGEIEGPGGGGHSLSEQSA